MDAGWTEQKKREYIRHAEANLFVIAGPGTGKTTLLSKRIINQIKAGEHISHFLLIAFTREAAEEFRSKLRKHLKREASFAGKGQERLLRNLHQLHKMQISTMEEFCAMIVQRYKRAAGQEEEEQRGTERAEEAARRLLQEDPELRRRLRSRYRKIYADEIQDLDRVQLGILWRLACTEDGRLRDNSLFAVGDARQAIFLTEDQEAEAFFELKRRMQEQKNARVLFLDDNYRANAEIVSWVNRSFQGRFSEYTKMNACQTQLFPFPFTGLYRYEGGSCREAVARELVGKLMKSNPALRLSDFLLLSCPDCAVRQCGNGTDGGAARARQRANEENPEEIGEGMLPVLAARQSKGLNANIVIVLGCSVRKGRPGKGEKREQSRSVLTRLEYVAATRAKHALIFLTCEEDCGWFREEEYSLSLLPKLFP